MGLYRVFFSSREDVFFDVYLTLVNREDRISISLRISGEPRLAFSVEAYC